jgi:hypothetical protein
MLSLTHHIYAPNKDTSNNEALKDLLHSPGPAMSRGKLTTSVHLEPSLGHKHELQV